MLVFHDLSYNLPKIAVKKNVTYVEVCIVGQILELVWLYHHLKQSILVPLIILVFAPTEASAHECGVVRKLVTLDRSVHFWRFPFCHKTFYLYLRIFIQEHR